VLTSLEKLTTHVENTVFSLSSWAIMPLILNDSTKKIPGTKLYMLINIPLITLSLYIKHFWSYTQQAENTINLIMSDAQI
jgi:hypothetical protein